VRDTHDFTMPDIMPDIILSILTRDKEPSQS